MIDTTHGGIYLPLEVPYSARSMDTGAIVVVTGVHEMEEGQTCGVVLFATVEQAMSGTAHCMECGAVFPLQIPAPARLWAAQKLAGQEDGR